MLTDDKMSIEKYRIDLFRAYLASMENFLVDEVKKYRERVRTLETESQGYQAEIKVLENQLENQTEKEREVAFEKALLDYEQSWIDGFYSPVSTADNYYDSPYWGLEIAKMDLSCQQFELEINLNFPSILRRSSFVNLYSFLESTLMQECQEEPKKSKEPLIKRAMKHLISVQKVPFVLGKSMQWSQIQNYNKLRNCIVHAGGRLDRLEKPKRDQLKKFVNSESGLSLSGDEIILSANFCSKALDTIESFLVSVLCVARQG